MGRGTSSSTFHNSSWNARFAVHGRSSRLVDILRGHLLILLLLSLLAILVIITTKLIYPLLVLKWVCTDLILLAHIVCRDDSWMARINSCQIWVTCNFLQLKNFVTLTQSFFQVLRKIANATWISRFKSSRKKTLTFWFTKVNFIWGWQALSLHSLKLLCRLLRYHDRTLFVESHLLVHHWWVTCSSDLYIFKLNLLRQSFTWV